jgi:multidrug resistance efflux pump
MVRKGQPLLSIYSPELVSAQEEFLLALKIKKLYAAQPSAEFAAQGENLLQSARKRLLLWDITSKQVENLEKTGEIQKNLVLFSPVDGFVMEKTVFKGMGIMPGTTLYKIGDLSSIWAIADIYEYEIPLVQAGQKAAITLSYFPGESFEGTATYIYPSVDPRTRTAKAAARHSATCLRAAWRYRGTGPDRSRRPPAGHRPRGGPVGRAGPA